jgi:UvrD-like helicase C-terminal domain
VLASRVGTRRYHLGVDNIVFAAMTAQQAKNREFDGVVVLLPSKSTGTPNTSGDCFYNAITRARRWCTVIVQSEELLKAPPFA